jgi:hypothetical protein
VYTDNTMKKLILLTLALSLPLAQVVSADNDSERRKHKRQADEQRSEQAARARLQSAHRTTNQPAQRATRNNPRAVAPAVRSEPSLEGRNRPGPQVSNHDRQNRSVDRDSFTVARSRVIRVPHDRNWWRRHFNTTFVLFGGGYYYWWGGYWYPAYGYSPYYNNYLYSEPIYGYNNLDPGQVIENVQLALRDQGYYPGAIDGVVGTQTRAALAAFQRDNGLIVTAAVDQPTLVTLGLA